MGLGCFIRENRRNEGCPDYTFSASIRWCVSRCNRRTSRRVNCPSEVIIFSAYSGICCYVVSVRTRSIVEVGSILYPNINSGVSLPRSASNGIVLASGYATRLWPITKHRPNILLPIGEPTVIGTVLEAIESDERIEDVYISTNAKFASSFESYLVDSDFDKPQRSVEETIAESERLGIVEAL